MRNWYTNYGNNCKRGNSRRNKPAFSPFCENGKRLVEWRKLSQSHRHKGIEMAVPTQGEFYRPVLETVADFGEKYLGNNLLKSPP